MHSYALYDDFIDKKLLNIGLIFLSIYITMVWPKPGSDVINGFLGTPAFQQYP